MTCSEKIKTIYNKIKKSKAQYDFDIQTGDISSLSAENVNKFKFLISKYVLPVKYLEIAAILKNF